MKFPLFNKKHRTPDKQVEACNEEPCERDLLLMYSHRLEREITNRLTAGQSETAIVNLENVARLHFERLDAIEGKLSNGQILESLLRIRTEYQLLKLKREADRSTNGSQEK